MGFTNHLITGGAHVVEMSVLKLLCCSPYAPYIYISIYSYIFTYIWAIGGVNVGKYSIHGVYGFHNLFNTSWCKAMLHLRQQSPGPVLYGFGSGVCQSQCLDWKDTGVLGTTVPQSTKRYMTQVNLDIANKNRFFYSKTIGVCWQFYGYSTYWGSTKAFWVPSWKLIGGKQRHTSNACLEPKQPPLVGLDPKQYFCRSFFWFSALPLSLCLFDSLSPSLSLLLPEWIWFFYSQSCWWSIKINPGENLCCTRRCEAVLLRGDSSKGTSGRAIHHCNININNSLMGFNINMISYIHHKPLS